MRRTVKRQTGLMPPAGKRLVLIICALFLSGLGAFRLRASAAPAVVWAGRGHYRLLLKVEPVDTGKRASDEMPADVEIDFAREISERFGVEGRLPNIASIQVIKYDDRTGKPLTYGKYAYATSPYDRPFRWYDAAIPEDYPENESNIDQTGGELKWTTRKMWGYFYNAIGDWQRGRLAWTHTQEGNTASYYAVYFDLLHRGEVPKEVPPRGFIGDGMNRCNLKSSSTTGLIHSRVALTDWNGDGLIDMVVGCARGGIVVYPNTGSKTDPKFPYSKLVFMADGKPLDVGWSSAPLAVDWDGDGIRDLLVGAEWNRIVFFKNVGSNSNPRFINKGLVKADGKPLELPHEPVPEGEGIYKRDYYPVPEVVDWDGDGRPDLLAGGYVTGMIFFYKNVGREADGTPRLSYQGPLYADGKPLDVGWAAAPCVADFDGDGLPDLITGSMPMTPGGGDSASSEDFLWYFKNIGTRTKPVLTRRPFPQKGRFPRSALGTPRAADINGDGLLDLVVSANTDIYIYKNIGTRESPLFEVNENPLPSQWGSESLPHWGAQYVDWNGDGRFDILSGLTVSLNLGKGSPGIFAPAQPLLPPNETISHHAVMGDDWTFTQMADLDGDGRPDLLFGDHRGNIWFHKNLSTPQGRRFDTRGIQLQTTDGRPIKVGPREGQAMDFDVLQGARTTFTAADFDGDGRVDLVVGDTYGKVRFYRNETGGATPVFAQPVLIGEMGTRMTPAATDWNGDGLMDVIGAAANGEVKVFYGTRADGRSGFAPGQPLKLPALPYGPTVTVVDWNGDGDDDLMVSTAYGYMCWFERSFLKHGYRRAEKISFEKR